MNLARLLSLTLLALPAVATAQDYTPKFARVEQRASVLDPRLCHKPEWPRELLRNLDQGVTTLRFQIAPTGKLVAMDVARSSGFAAFDKAAMVAMEHCSFRPGSVNGVPVQSSFFIQFVWAFR